MAHRIELIAKGWEEIRRGSQKALKLRKILQFQAFEHAVIFLKTNLPPAVKISSRSVIDRAAAER